MTCLNACAVVHPTNESLNDHTTLSQELLRCAGPKLKMELVSKIKCEFPQTLLFPATVCLNQLFYFPDCRTGEVKMTQGYNLPARYIIHTAGPKYNSHYKTAAETALYSCYRLFPVSWFHNQILKLFIVSCRNVLELVHEHHLSSVAIPIIYTVKRGYPPDEGAHLALREFTLFLENPVLPE